MKKEHAVHKFTSISEAYRAFGLHKPKHPLITVINGLYEQADPSRVPQNHVLSFYKIAFKPKIQGKLRYGQGYYDFDEGGLLFASPGQVMGSHDVEASACSERTLLIHPDFFLGFPLARAIKQYGFFSYATHEALHLSEEEK